MNQIDPFSCILYTIQVNQGILLLGIIIRVRTEKYQNGGYRAKNKQPTKENIKDKLCDEISRSKVELS